VKEIFLCVCVRAYVRARGSLLLEIKYPTMKTEGG